MILFFISIAVLVIAVLALLLPVFSRDAGHAEPNRTDINVGIARAQAQELQQRLESGEISADDYADEKARLEASLARDIEKEELTATVNTQGQWLFWPVAVAIPVAAGALYLTLGTPQALDPKSFERPPQQVNAPQQQVPQQAPPIEEIIAGIQQRLEVEPDNAEAWFMLGRAHLTVGEYPDAVAALRKSVAIDDSNVNVRIRLADALALSQNRSLAGEPAEILKSVLEIEPQHPQGLWLYGMALNETGQPAEAIDVWNRLLPLLSSDPRSQGEVEQLIAGAQAQLPAGERARTAGETANPQAADNSAGDTGTAEGVEVVVDVIPGLADGLPPDTPVFVYAKAVNGPPMPLAVVRRSLADLPLTLTLSDAQAMIENMKITAFEEVIVGARISKSGNPVGQPGDLYFETGSVDTANLTAPVKITISESLP